MRNRALELIGKELGMFVDRGIQLPVRLADLPDSTIDSMLKEAEEAVARENAIAAERTADVEPEPIQ